MLVSFSADDLGKLGEVQEVCVSAVCLSPEIGLNMGSLCSMIPSQIRMGKCPSGAIGPVAMADTGT